MENDTKRLDVQELARFNRHLRDVGRRVKNFNKQRLAAQMVACVEVARHCDHLLKGSVDKVQELVNSAFKGELPSPFNKPATLRVWLALRKAAGLPPVRRREFRPEPDYFHQPKPPSVKPAPKPVARPVARPAQQPRPAAAPAAAPAAGAFKPGKPAFPKRFR